MPDIPKALSILKKKYRKKLALDYAEGPFEVLISTIISQRTKDEVTIAASERLFKKFPSAKKLAAAKESDIAKLIYPAGFYRTKAPKIKAVSEYASRHGVPDSMESLLELPGVGRKTANCVLSYGFGMQAIAVDTHVHRISNRLGWVRTKTPEQTEMALEKLIPKRQWRSVNSTLVAFGQDTCRPARPKCPDCPIRKLCPSALLFY
ncbi:MAG: endonuclease III [archaeon]